jgi:hypothetical protein
MFCVRQIVRAKALKNSTHLLLVVRLSPLVFAAAITFGLALPAFLEFEPHATAEGIGLRLDAMALAGALLFAGMACRGWRMLSTTRRARQSWREQSEGIYLPGIDLPTYCLESSSALVAVTGTFRPEIFLSRGIVEALSTHELRAALEHEVAHVRSFDNLKQLLLKMTRPPHWLQVFKDVDREWNNAAEIAADRRALSRGASVLDLSSALVKVGRLTRIPTAAQAVASRLVPTSCSSTLERRVKRLSELLENNEHTTVHSAFQQAGSCDLPWNSDLSCRYPGCFTCGA